MADDPKLPPVPDALRGNRPAPAEPKIDIFRDPLNPLDEPAPPKRANAGEEEPAAEVPSRSLAEFDAPHAFASVLGSGIGRAALLVITCMVVFGITEACYRVSLLVAGWQAGGIGGFFRAIFAVPGSLLVAPGHWIASLGGGILKPLGVPYLLLCVGGLILAVRSEINIIKLALFYALLTAVQAAAFMEMKHPISILLWLGMIWGIVWLYRWYWRQQIAIEESSEEEET
jgi:hypothetical protein